MLTQPKQIDNNNNNKKIICIDQFFPYRFVVFKTSNDGTLAFQK